MKKLVLIISLVLCAASHAHATSASSPLRIGVLLIEDSVPFYVAEQEHFYKDAKVEVKLVPFLSALERDSALAAGAIDGAISDPVGTILFDKGQGHIKITSIGLGQTPAEGVFAILSAPGSSIQSADQLANVEIGISSGTIIEYVTDRLLAQHGLTPEQIRKIEVKKMPIRMQMLLAGSIEAATLPEPLASIAAGKGATILLSDANSPQSLSQTVIVIRTETLLNRKTDVAALFEAYDRAVQAINDDPERFRPLFVEKGRIPPFLTADYPIPTYPRPAPFSKALYEPVISWLSAKNLVGDISYETMVATDFMER